MRFLLQTLISVTSIFFAYSSTPYQFKCSGQADIPSIISNLSNILTNEIRGNDNYFISPLSISIALGMVFVGARGKTKAQMIKTLQYDNSCPIMRCLATNDCRYTDTCGSCLDMKLSEGYQHAISAIAQNANMNEFRIANGMLVQKNHTLNQRYRNILEENFKTAIMYTDFFREPQKTLDLINAFVEEATRGHITNLVRQPLSVLTVMVLMNVVYFKGLWDIPFAVSATTNGVFHVNQGISIPIPFMRLTEEIMYFEDRANGYKFIELDYIGRNTSMLIMIPINDYEIPMLEFTIEMKHHIYRNLKHEPLDLMMPRFHLEYSREMSNDMKNLGVVDLFTERADLSEIRDVQDLHVSMFVHKAVIDVNEKGSVASAATGLGIDARRKTKDQIEVWLNHPFMFSIMDKRSGIILFTGRLVHPDPVISPEHVK